MHRSESLRCWTQSHRKLPAAIDVPATAAEFVAAELNETITSIAAEQHTRTDDADSNQLEDAINDIFGDWKA